MQSERKIAFFYGLIIRGGVEVALRNLLQRLSVDAEVFVVYSDDRSDKAMLDELRPYATVTKHLEYADIVVECSVFQRSNIIAGYRIQWIHGNIIECRVAPINKSIVEKCIAVSDEAARQFGGADVYLNELDARIYDLADQPIEWDFDGLRLLTVSRISQQKGFERMPALCDELKKQGIKHEWVIIGKGFSAAYEAEVRQLLGQYNVRFVGELPNPYPYMKAADYVVQLSDAESFGLSTMEGQVLGTPSIITNYTVAQETLGGYAHIIEKDMSNVRAIVKNIHNKPGTRTYSGDSDKWNKLLNSIRVEHGMIVKATKRFIDLEADKKRLPGEKWECSTKRAKALKELGLIEIIEQATTKRIQEGIVEKRKAVRSR